MTADSSYSLEALESQWQNGKVPKLGLQLAEAHRRRGDLSAAIEVLEAGLDDHPEHLSSRVALSRYLVDSDRFSESLRHLEKIVRADPVHLVANKLMVKAFLGLGRLDEARDKLDIYEMLGEGDAEIEGLRAQVNGEPWPPEAEEVAPEPADELLPAVARTEELVATTEPPEPPEPPEPVEPGPLSMLGGGDGIHAALQHEEASASAVFDSIESEPSAPESPSADSASEPFGSVWTAEPTTAHWSGGGDNDVFSLEPEEPTAVAPATPRLGDEEARRVEPGAESTGEATAEDRDDGDGKSGLANGRLPDAVPSASQGATVTLGRLYLEQGDADKAAACFEEVLERDPDNQSARLALASMGRGGSSLAERKKAVLIAYRSRIRRAVEGRT